MRHLPRLLWLLAWAGWAWLGVGLYRELPRDPGPILRQLPLGQQEAILGFVKDTSLVVIQPQPYFKGQPFKVYDAATGAFVRDIPFQRDMPLYPFRTVRSHGVVFGHMRGRNVACLRVIDLATGESRPLSEKIVPSVAAHPTKPWAAFRESAPPIDKPRRPAVIDWTTSAELFVRPRDADTDVVGEPFFIDDADRLAIPITRQDDPDAHDAVDLEIWRVTPPARREKVIRLPYVGHRLQPTRSGRIAWMMLDRDDYYVEVFDIDAERVVFTTPRINRGPPTRQQSAAAFHLSSTGRGLLGTPGYWVWQVDTGKELWFSKQGLQSSPTDGLDLFEVEEHWDQPWTHGRFSNWATAAFRELDTGALRFRCWNAAAAMDHTNADATLGCTRQGAVHRLPFRVNWTLLSLSQAILALPLVLLWTILRWRRLRRAARRQPSVAAS